MKARIQTTIIALGVGAVLFLLFWVGDNFPAWTIEFLMPWILFVMCVWIVCAVWNTVWVLFFEKGEK